MREWLGDRPLLVALLALLTPALLSVVFLGASALVPDVQVARGALPQFTLGLPGMSSSSGGPGSSSEGGGSRDQAAAPDPLPALGTGQVVPPGRAAVRVPILEYHYVRVNPDPRDRLGFNLSVTPADFAAQMEWLARSGFHPIEMDDLREYFQQQLPLPSRPVVLTFDDGYEDFFTAALPVLRSHGFGAVAYVVPGFLDHPRYMTSAQVREIDAEGIDVAAHTLHHVDLTRANGPELTAEVQGSRTELQKLVGHPVLDFCYPSGKFDAAVVAATQQAGFQSATTEVPGTAHGWSDRLTWTRVRVNGGERLDQFVASLGEPESTVSLPAGV